MLALIIAVFAMIGAFKRSDGIAEESEGSMLLPLWYMVLESGTPKKKSTSGIPS
jgi:hypothetical protein